jgi:rubredoxin
MYEYIRFVFHQNGFMSKHRRDILLIKPEPWEHRFIQMKKEFKMTRDIDIRKDTHCIEHDLCLRCKTTKNNCICIQTVKKYGALSCDHCGYDYTQNKGKLVDTVEPNTFYISAYKKYQVQPCDKCNKKYALELDEQTNWDEEGEFEKKILYQKIDAYLNRY